MTRPRILTGIRPTGPLHIGHLLGQVQQTVAMQENYHVMEMIADVQALTDNFATPGKVRDNVMEVAMDLLAAGIDPKKSILFLQSGIREIPELTMYFSNLVTISRLLRNPTVKSEISQKASLFGEGGVTYGFLGYPVSQAADITIFDADLVPAGEDQAPIIEQTRELVRKFNGIYGDTLKEPLLHVSKTPRLPGTDGDGKMSKSVGNTVNLKDDQTTMEQRILKTKTDPEKIHKDSPGRPEICTAFTYHTAFATPTLARIKEECLRGARGCVDCKKELAAHMDTVLGPIRERRRYFEQREDLVRDILKDGTTRAQTIASEVMERVRDHMYLNHFHN